jgi:hypothetical protein
MLTCDVSRTCVCVCVRERERESVCVRVCVYVRMDTYIRAQRKRSMPLICDALQVSAVAKLNLT